MRALLILLALLITYGSLYPFAFAPHEGDLRELRALLTDYSLPLQRGDIVGNLLLFMPYGLVIALGARTTHRRWAQLLGLVLGVVLAVLLQIVQIWLPSRVPALGDAIINTAGMLLGYGLGHLGQRLSPRANPDLLWQAVVPLGLMLLWVSTRWFPLIPTIDLQNVKDAFKPLLLNPSLDAARIFTLAVSWLCFFKLFDFTPARHTPALLRALLGLGITLGQAFFVGTPISANQIAGLTLAIIALPVLQSRHALVLLAVALLASVLVLGTHPFRLSDQPGRFHWIPFTGMLEGNMETNTRALALKAYLYGTLIYLIHANGARLAAATLVTVVWLALIEALQIFIPGRSAEITDPVLALILGIAIAHSRK